MSVTDRIERLLRERGVPPRKIKRTISEICGVSYEAVRQWFSGATENIDIRYLEMISQKYYASTNWLRTGKGEMNWKKMPEAEILNGGSVRENGAIYLTSTLRQVPINPISTWDSDTALDDDETEIKFLKSVEGSAGNGSQVFEADYGYKLRFSKRTLSRLNIVPDNAVCIMVTGNSMEPQLPDGATVGVDTADKTIRDGKIYAINHGSMIRIKVLYRLPSGIRIRSYNQEEHPDEIYSQQEMHDENIFIIGRVFWSSVLY